MHFTRAKRLSFSWFPVENARKKLVRCLQMEGGRCLTVSIVKQCQRAWIDRAGERKEYWASFTCQIFSPKGKAPTLERAFKHRKNCDSCPTKVTWKVKLKCQFCLSCRSPPIGQDDLLPSYYSKWKALMTVFVWKLKVVWSHITSILCEMCEEVGGYLTMCAHCRVDVSEWQNSESLS